MRKSLAFLVVSAAFLTAACSDSPTANRLVSPGPAVIANSLSDDIDKMIVDFFPRGLETATGTKWATVKLKLAAGDVAGARKHLVDLTKFITLKTGDIEAPAGETRQHAATRLVLSMATYVFNGPDAPPPSTGADASYAVLPAGGATTLQTPSQHAAIRVDQASTADDRILVVTQNPDAYPAKCQGPLPTRRCQYPLFYKFEIYPHTRFLKPAHFAVCMVTTGDRRPLDNPSQEGPGIAGPVHQRMRLAHNAPVAPTDRTPGGFVEGEIEILPLTAAQQKTITCDEKVAVIRDGWVGVGQRVALAIGRGLAHVFGPKTLYAWDAGPEHDATLTSDFNGVDGESTSDLSVSTPALSPSGEAWGGDAETVTFTVENRSRRFEGLSTAASPATTASIYLYADADLTTRVSGPLAQDLAVAAMAPDATPQTISASVVLPTDIALDRTYWIAATVGADPFGEADAKNNTSATKLLIKQKKPDLAVGGEGFTLGSASVAAGSPVTTSTWTAKNLGNAASGPFSAQFYLVPPEGAPVSLGGAISYASIDPGAEASHAAVTLAVPAGTTPGSYGVVLKLDPDNAVAELDETNNSASQTLRVDAPEVPIALNLRSAEKLPKGTQHFFVASGSPGPYIWSVNGVDGGNSTYGTITTNADFSGDYTAPTSVPDQPTFDVCARRAASASNKACASVTIKPIPTEGQDVVVFNDINFFGSATEVTDQPDVSTNPNNQKLYANLADYTAAGPRATQSGVLLHLGHQSLLNPAGGPAYIQGFIDYYNANGHPVTQITDGAAGIGAIPANIKVLFLVLPTTSYSDAEINTLKQFATDGGRIVFIGEHQDAYGSYIASVENAFFQKMGAQLTNVGALIDCGLQTLPAASLRSHQITTGMTDVSMGCASKITLGPNDYGLITGSDGTSFIAAVAKIDVTPVSVVAGGLVPGAVRASLVAAPGVPIFSRASP